MIEFRGISWIIVSLVMPRCNAQSNNICHILRCFFKMLWNNLSGKKKLGLNKIRLEFREKIWSRVKNLATFARSFPLNRKPVY